MEQQLTKGAVYLTFSSALFIGASYLTNIWLGRLLGPEWYGRYGLVVSLWSTVNLILTAGLPQAVSRAIATNREKAHGIFVSACILQAISVMGVTVFFLTLSYPISLVLGDHLLFPYIALSAFIIPVYSFYSLYLGYYNGLHKFKKQAFMSMVYAFSKLFFIGGLAYYWGLGGAIVGFIVSPVVSLLAGFSLPLPSLNRYPIKPLIYSAIPLVGFSVVSTLMQSVDLYLVKTLLPDPNAPGFYTASQNIAKIPFFGLSAFSLVVYPAIAHSISNNLVKQTRSLIETSLRFMLIILVPIVLIITLTGSQLLQFLYGNEYLPASSALAVLAVGFGAITIFSILANILNGAGQAKISLQLSTVATITAFAISLLMIPSMGITGAAWGTTLGGALATVLAAAVIYRHFSVLLPFLSMIRIVLAGMALYGAAQIIPVAGKLLPLEYLILLSVYAGVLLLLGELSPVDVERFKRFRAKNIVSQPL